MANRYWVGGSASWDGTAGTKWSATSGGLGGQSVPNFEDDVFFDNNSGPGTVTIAAGNNGAKTINCTGFTGQLTGTAGITVSGDITLVSAMTFNYSGTITINASAIFISAGKLIGGLTFSPSNSSNILTIGDPLSITSGSSVLTLTSGTINLNNQPVSASSFSSSNTNVRSLIMGSSTFTLSNATPWNTVTTTNFNLNPGTSTIILSSSSVTFNGAGLIYNNVSLTDTTATTLFKTINGANTFNNLTIATPAGSGCNNIRFGANQTITGTLTATGSGGFIRLALISDTIDTQRTLTCAAIAATTDVDFRDIRITGAAAPLIGTRLGDCGGNTGITFAAPRTVWWSNSVGGNWGGDNFGATSGGPVNIANFPQAQDTVIINNAGAVAAGLTISINGNYHMPGIDMTTRTTSLTFGSVATFVVSFYGDLLYAGVVTTTGTSTYVFANRTIRNWSSPAISTFGGPLIIEAPGGGLNILGTSGSIRTNSDIEVRRGTLTTNSVNFSQVGRFLATGSGVKVLNWGTTTVTSSSTTPLAYWNITGTNISWSGAPNINDITAGASNFTGGGYPYGTLTINPTGTVHTVRTISGTNTFSSISWTIGGGASNGWWALSLIDNQTVTGNFTITGAQSIYRAFIRSNTIGTTRTLSVGGTMSSSYIDFRDVTLTGAAAPLSGTRLGDCGGNSGITFDAPSTKWYSGGVGGPWFANVWANSAGGATSFENIPLAQDTAIIPNTSLGGPSAGSVITLLAPLNMPSLNLSTRTQSLTLNLTDSTVATGYTTFWYGDIITSSSVTWDSPRADFSTESTITICNRSIKIIDTSGNTIPASLSINCPGGGANFTFFGITQVTRYLSLTSLDRGTLQLAAFATLTTGYFSSSGTGQRQIIFDTGSRITSAGSLLTTTALFLADPTNLTVTGDSDFRTSGAGARIINIGTMTETNSVNVTVFGPTPTFVSSGTCTIRSLSLQSTGSITLASNMILYGNLTMPANTFVATTNTITFASTVTGRFIFNSSNVSIPVPLIFNGVGGGWRLEDNTGLITSIELRNGSLNLNGKTLSAGSFSTGEGTKDLTLNGATFTITGSGSTTFNNANPTGFTVTAGTGTGRIALNSSSAKTFVGGGTTYNCTVRQAGSGTLTITGNNTFNAFENTVSPTAITFTANTTNTFNTWNVSGSLLNLVTIRSSTPGVPYTLSKTSGTVSSGSLDLQDSIATGGATWQSYLVNNNINSGNNLGWQFYLNTASRGYIIT